MTQRCLTLILIFFSTLMLQSQVLDTLVDVGGYKLHFNIIKGKGTPILFEPGNSFKGLPWNGTLELIHQITGATIITYDRSGFGKSELNPNEKEASKFGIINGMEELETALIKLGYNNNIMLVAHSFGTFYASLFAARHPEKTKGLVLLNGHLPGYWTEARLAKNPDPDKNKLELKDYYLRKNFSNTVRTVGRAILPTSIPVIDIVADIPLFFLTEQDAKDWKEAHEKFADESQNREGIVAHGSGHYIFKDNEVLFLSTVTKAYATTLNGSQKLAVLSRGNDMIIERSNIRNKTQD